MVLLLCFSAGIKTSAQTSIISSTHLNKLSEFIKHSEQFNNEIDSYFRVNSKKGKFFCFVGDTSLSDSTRIPSLDTRSINESARIALRENKRKESFVYQVRGQGDSLYYCDIYPMTYKILRGASILLFCNFRMIYVIDEQGQIDVIRFDKPIIM